MTGPHTAHKEYFLQQQRKKARLVIKDVLKADRDEQYALYIKQKNKKYYEKHKMRLRQERMERYWRNKENAKNR